MKWPFFYLDRIHTKQSLIAIAVVWGITIVYAIVVITLISVLDGWTWKYLEDVTFLSVVITGYIALFISNSFVFIEAWRHLKKTEIIILSSTNIAREPSNALNNKEKEYRKKEFKPVKVNTGLILCFFLL